MQINSSPWTAWWQEDLPCRFSREEAIRNRDFLTDLLGQAWLQRAMEPQSNHPLISQWMTNGANAFLLLNALAEDSRILVSILGFDQVLNDLRDGRRCLPTWHLIRAAAMFQRAGTVVSRFYEQKDQSVPDFSINFNSTEVNVEAKLLLESDLEKTFEQYATPLCQKVFTEVMSQETIHPPVTIIFKDVGDLAEIEKVVDTVSVLVRDSRIPPKECRTQSFNVFVDPSPIGSGLFRGCYALCPRSEKENLRVASRVKEASRQLIADPTSECPGIFWLGITRHQNAVFLRNLLLHKFEAGHFGGVSQIFLLHSGTHLEPPRRSVVDYGTRLVNFKSRAAFSVQVPVRPLDLTGDVITVHGSQKGLSAYRVGAVETRYLSGMSQLMLPDFRHLTQESLE